MTTGTENNLTSPIDMCQPDAHAALVHETKDYFFPLDTRVNYSKNNPDVCKLLKWDTGNGR